MEDRPNVLSDAVRHFCTAARVKVRQSAVKNELEVILKGARATGLTSEEINSLCKVISSNTVGNGIRLAVMKCLLPAQFVPVEAVLTLLSWMNTPDATKNIQGLILRWCTAVYEFTDNVKLLHLVYPMLFFYLKCDTLRKHVCPLLLFLTKKDDVLPFRVSRLMRLRAVIGNDPYLNEILSLYKFYCPHLVSLRLKMTSKVKPLASTYNQWTKYINEIQQQNVGVGEKITMLYQNSLAFWKSQDDIPPPGLRKTKKEKYSDNLPAIIDALDIGSDDKKAIPMNGISSFKELLSVIDRVQLPAQTLIALRYPVVQNLVSCFRNKEYVVRFNYNLRMILYSDFGTETNVIEVKAAQMILSKLIQFSQYLQEGIPVVAEFLAGYLNFEWNGIDFAENIFKIITWTRLMRFEELQQNFLLRLKGLYYSYKVNYKLAVIHCLIELLDNYLYVELERRKKFVQLSQNLINMDDAWTYVYLFVEEQDEYSPLETIIKLMEFIHELIITGIILENCNTRILHAAASFYEMVRFFMLLM
ncbi:hypothetical protein CHUAL_005681 [Chamberlinius hualienensis]